jgi:hypothetical protein
MFFKFCSVCLLLIVHAGTSINPQCNFEAVVTLTLLVPRADISAFAPRVKSAASRYISSYRLAALLLQNIIQTCCVVIITFILHVICENFITNPFFVNKKINKFISKKITSYCFYSQGVTKF